MLAPMDVWGIYITISVIIMLVFLLLLYFVIKAAVKNAFIEDRAFQAKAQRMRTEKQGATK